MLDFIKNQSVRETGTIHTVKDGALRAVSELWVMTKDGLRLVWQAIKGNFLTSDGDYFETKEGEVFNVTEDL